jgi:hypothetical protein
MDAARVLLSLYYMLAQNRCSFTGPLFRHYDDLSTKTRPDFSAKSGFMPKKDA